MSYYITNECVGCTLCAKKCPAHAISGKLKERHVIDPGLCIDCGLCGRLCAKGAVTDDDGVRCEKLPKDAWKKPEIDSDLCAGCSVCIENCPAGALSLTEPQFKGDIRTVAALTKPENCIGCGICESVCPISAITL